MQSIRIPQRRKAQQHDFVSLIAEKKKRAERRATHEYLDKLFVELEAEPVMEDVWAREERLVADGMPIESSLMKSHVTKVANGFLDTVASERLAEVLVSCDTVTDKEQYRFFVHPCHLAVLEPWPLEDPCPKTHFIHQLSQDAKGRQFLVQSGCLYHWYRGGWQCPLSVYHYLYKIVAYEEECTVARHAYETLKHLWTDWRTDTDEVHPHGMVDPAWLYDIIGHYGGRSFPSPQGTLLPSFLMTATVHPHQPLPTLHLGWVLSLLAQSVQQWPNAYTASLPSLVSLLLHLLSDPATQPITDTLHHTLHTCLVTLPSPWKSKLHSIVHALEPASMLPMLQAFLPVDSRAVYLQRALAASALGLVSFHLDTLLGLLQDPTSVFCATPIDYPGLVTMTRLMDIAIGSNEHQFQDNKATVQAIILHLQLLGRKLGGRVGVLEKTMANEVIQRLWNRLAYVLTHDDPLDAQIV